MNQLAKVKEHTGSLPGAFSRLVIIAACALLCVFSRTALTSKYASVDSYRHEIEVLDQQKETTAKLSIATGAASAAISCIPDDVCTPIANELAEICKGLTLVTGAILLEKYLLTVLGYAFFAWLVPLYCVVAIIVSLAPKRAAFRTPLMVGLLKVLIVGLIGWRAVPISVFVVDSIGQTYDITINEAIDNAQEISEEVSSKSSKQEQSKEKTESSGNFFEKGLNDIGNAVTTTVDNVVDLTAGKAQELVAWAKVVLTQVTEGFAVLVITSVAIPILTPVLIVWLVKVFFQPTGLTAGAPAVPALPLPRKEDKEESVAAQDDGR